MHRVASVTAVLVSISSVQGFTVGTIAVGSTGTSSNVPRWHMVDEAASKVVDQNDFDDFDFFESLDLLDDDDPIKLFLEDELLQQEIALDEHSDEQTQSVDGQSQFLALLDSIPPGKMDLDEISLIRNVLQELVENQQETHTAESAQKVETVLLRMLDEYDSGKRNGDLERMKVVEPKVEDFSMVMQVWLESDCKEARDKAVAFYFVQQDFFAQTGLCRPTLDIVETALVALADSRGRDADRKAWAIVDRLAEYQLSPTVSIYHSLITSLARSRNRGAAQRAEDALMEAVTTFPPSLDGKGRNVGMTVDSFNVVLTAWAKSELEDGPDRAGKLLMRMEEVDNKQGILKPTASSFTSLIDAYTQMKTWESACQAERTLNALLNFYLVEEQDPTLEPSIATWGIVLACWQRLSKKGSNDAASNAAKLLNRLETLHTAGKLSYGPDAIAYVTVLNAWCQCKDSVQNGAKHAEQLLDEMNERYMDGDDSYKPSAKSVRAVVDAWVKSDRQEALFKAEEIFERYDDMDYLSDPNDQDIVKDIYKTLVFGWSKNEDPERAHELLVEMVECGFHPDSFCFDKVIEAYTVEGGHRFKEVNEVFHLMEKCSEAGEVKPNERVYTSFIRAMTKAKVPGLAKEALGVLQRMHSLSLENRGIKPTVFTYNAVLKACATDLSDDSVTNLEAFKVALSVFNELRAPDTKEEPDHVTFGNMLQCAALLPQGPQREAMIASTFQLCCRRGFVNTFVLRDLQLVATEELWRELCQCPEGDANIDHVPQAWVQRFSKVESPKTSQPYGEQRGKPGGRRGPPGGGNKRSYRK